MNTKKINVYSSWKDYCNKNHIDYDKFMKVYHRLDKNKKLAMKLFTPFSLVLQAILYYIRLPFKYKKYRKNTPESAENTCKINEN